MTLPMLTSSDGAYMPNLCNQVHKPLTERQWTGLSDMPKRAQRIVHCWSSKRVDDFVIVYSNLCQFVVKNIAIEARPANGQFAISPSQLSVMGDSTGKVHYIFPNGYSSNNCRSYFYCQRPIVHSANECSGSGKQQDKRKYLPRSVVEPVMEQMEASMKIDFNHHLVMAFTAFYLFVHFLASVVVLAPFQALATERGFVSLIHCFPLAAPFIRVGLGRTSHSIPGAAFSFNHTVTA